MKKILFILFIATSISACKKGDTGPAGPAGTNGNANVQTYVFTNVQWTNCEIRLEVPAITQSVLDRGTVNIWGVPSGPGTGWEVLPSGGMSVGINVGIIGIIPDPAISCSDLLPMNIKVTIITAP